ncbi:hypothetical protein FBUS_00463 [Fasciolopsis buskii]|uniref:Uncharacterized protein n=1 Tax=Fasciolopsis buskii TaxID=27845 RepID=A0A8E0RMG0_9TREM|nr:hypothetical protein FBUS_00463 [Fasciolopsis buski]
MSRKSLPRKSETGKLPDLVECEWPAADQLFIPRDLNSDNVKLALNWCTPPEHVIPKCPACGCRQIPTECTPKCVNYETVKEKEQRDSYMGYLHSFSGPCTCEAARTSRLVSIVPCCGEPVACDCNGTNVCLASVPVVNGTEGFCSCTSVVKVLEPCVQPPGSPQPAEPVKCDCCLPQMEPYYTVSSPAHYVHGQRSASCHCEPCKALSNSCPIPCPSYPGN